MPTLADLVADVVSYTDESATTLPTLTVESFVNRVRRRMMRRHGWQGQQTSIDLPYPANAESIPLPDDFIAEYGVWLLTSTSPSRKLGFLKKTQRALWLQGNSAVVGSTDTTYPQVADPTVTRPTSGYYLWGRALYRVPIPIADETEVLDYYWRLPDLTGTQADYLTDVFPDVVLAGSLAEAYRYLHEEDARGPAWEQIFEQRLADGIRDDERLAGSGPSKTRGVT